MFVPFGAVGVPQHVWGHLEVHRIHQFGIVRLMLTKPWLYSMLDGLLCISRPSQTVFPSKQFPSK